MPPDENPDESVESNIQPADDQESDRLDALASEDLVEIKQLLATVVQREQFWLGPLPSDESVKGYSEVSPDLVQAIIDDFQRRSVASVEAPAEQFKIANRKLDIEQVEQAARLKGDQDDIRYRWISGAVVWVIGIAAVIVLGISAVMFFEKTSPAGAAGILFLAIPVCVAIVVIGGKGRLSQTEGDTQVGSMTGVANAFGAASEKLEQAHQPSLESGTSKALQDPENARAQESSTEHL